MPSSIQDAENSIRFYQNTRGKENENETIQSEIDKLRAALSSETTKSCEKSFRLSDLMTNPARKALTIGVFLTALNQFSGCCAMLFYIATIFALSGSHLSPNMSAILVGAIQLVGVACANQLVDRAGRKVIIPV